jgi:hypothetical protein
MPDVFIVVVRTSELRSDKKYNRNGVPVSTIIIPKLESGTTLFAISVVLLMVSSFIARKFIGQQQGFNK